MKTAIVRLTEKADGLEVAADVRPVGEDLLVVLSGGKAHIGAVGLAEPRASLLDPKVVSATSSVYTFAGHREDAIAKELAEELARRLNRRVVVVAGMHWDDLSAEDIAQVVAICRQLAGQIAKRLKPG